MDEHVLVLLFSVEFLAREWTVLCFCSLVIRSNLAVYYIHMHLDRSILAHVLSIFGTYTLLVFIDQYTLASTLLQRGLNWPDAHLAPSDP